MTEIHSCGLCKKKSKFLIKAPTNEGSFFVCNPCYENLKSNTSKFMIEYGRMPEPGEDYAPKKMP